MNDETRMSEMEKTTVVSLLVIGSTALARGFYWIVSSKEQAHDSPLYMSMHEMLSLTFWGIPFFIGGLFLIIAAITLPYRNIKPIYRVSLILGGIICALFFFIITLAGMNNSLNWLSPLLFFVLSVGSGGYAYIGVLYYRK
ncbi:hypothetical protein [Staphylococcus caeli]|uniref:hypothetical protein n=1 Tax=Staphylococcus caeli TaxID=2201815 RepID=UPI003F56D253